MELDLDEEGLSLARAVKAMSNPQLVQLWNGMIDVDSVVAGELFMDKLLWHARGGKNKHQPKEDRPKPQPPPPSASKPSPPPPPPAFTGGFVLALPAPRPARDQPNKKTPSTTAGRAAHGGKKPQPTPITPICARKEGSDSEDRSHPPPASKPDDQAPQNSYKTVTVLCAPPHLAREMKRPASTSSDTECASTQGKKHRAV